MHTSMPKNELLPKIYQTREKLTHTCLKTSPNMPQMMHTCIMHNVCIVGTQDLYSGNTRSGICILETQDLHSGNTRSVFCIVETQDLHCGNTRSALWKHKICILETLESCLILVCSQDKDLMNHTSQEWLNGVHLLLKTHIIILKHNVLHDS